MLRRSGKSALVALLAAGAITLGAGVSSSAPVTIRANFAERWDDASVTVKKGTKVVWKNPLNLGTIHNVRSYGGNWTFKKITLAPGEQTGKRFKKRGTFRYRCTLHSFKQSGKWTGMVGKVRVTR
jgi:plastocyanin